MGKALSAYIDLLRFGAALLVLFGHVQLQVQASGLLALLGTFPHQGVVVFFVVSGYLVGGKLLNSDITLRFLKQYAVDRASRIYTVTVPAILLGLVVVAVLQARYQHISTLSDPCSASVMDFFASLVFLHEGLWTGPCGNQPFWSLIFEVYYYVLGALLIAALGLRGRGRLWFAAAALATIVYGLFEPTGLLPYGAVWLLGAAVAQKGRGARQTIVALVAVAGVLTLPLLVVKEVAKYDTIGAFLVAGSLMLMARVSYFPERIAKIAAWGAGFSFSLYLVHAPVLSAIETAGGYGADGSAAAYALLSLASLVCAYLFYLVFERRTPWVRRVLSEAFVPKSAPPRTDIDTPIGVSAELEDATLKGTRRAPTTPT